MVDLQNDAIKLKSDYKYKTCIQFTYDFCNIVNYIYIYIFFFFGVKNTIYHYNIYKFMYSYLDDRVFLEYVCCAWNFNQI